jgi:hypothetical protein
MENREEQELGLSPWRSATPSDEFWDRGLEGMQSWKSDEGIGCASAKLG